MKICNRIRTRLRTLLEGEQGIAYVEFALCSTALLLLFLGSIELTRYVLILQKVENTVSMIADVTTQTNPNTTPLSTTQMQQMMSAITDMMNPYTLGASDPNIYAIVTDVTKTGNNNPVVNWQYCGGGALSATSRIGATIGGTATLPNGFTMNAGEETVIGEVFYRYTPITNQHVIAALTIYRTSVYMPRLGALTGFSSHC